MSHPHGHSIFHSVTPGWMPKTKSFTPHLDEPGKFTLIFTQFQIIRIIALLYGRKASDADGHQIKYC